MTLGENIAGSGSSIGLDAAGDPVVIPGAVVDQFYRPTTAEEVAQVVKVAAKDRVGLLIAGGRTRLHWANKATGISLGLSLRGITGVDSFEPEEGVLHAGAGTPIREIQEVANAEGWELALDPPGMTSTLGGTIASAAIGPRSHAFGRVKDVVLGLEVVGGDGSLSKCGGRVVKNVTGYDLAKLYCGSFGSLAVLCGAWLRLRPRPALREAYAGSLASTQANFDALRGMGRGATVRALNWSERAGSGGLSESAAASKEAHVVVEFAGSAEGIAHDREQIVSAFDFESVPMTHVDALRDERSRLGSDSVILRARVVGSRCAEIGRVLLDLGLSVSIDPGLGVVHARGALESAARLLEIRRCAGNFGGSAYFEKMPDTWRDEVDVFDEQADGAALGLILKEKFDPLRIFNPGRFAGRI